MTVTIDEDSAVLIVTDDPDTKRPNARGGVVKFELDPFRKHCLLEGLDDIGLTLVEAPAIASYENKARAAHPWL